MSHKTTGQNSTRKPSWKMLGDLAGEVMVVLCQLSFERVEGLLKNKTLLKKQLESVFQTSTDPFADLRAEWQKFYTDHFGLTVDFSGVRIPEMPTDGSWRLLFVPMGLTLNTTLAVMQMLFRVEIFDVNLVEKTKINTRTSTTSYAVWVRNDVEPDEKHLGKSTRDADMMGTIGMTLLERLVLGFKFFTETDKHLDVRGVTVCTGSRDVNCSVPSVGWYTNNAVCVLWNGVDDYCPTDGLRSVVSL